VSRQNRILAAMMVALLIAGVGVGLLALFRVQQAKEFSRPRQVQTRDATNYVVRLLEAAVGRSDTGCVLILYMQLENPNSFEVTLYRKWFVLIDHDKIRYLPSMRGTQSELIKLPANGVLEKEMLSFTVPDDTFASRVTLMVDQKYRILVKDEIPFNVRLRNGEFRSFRRRSW
jgi:hypothetical protein